jgi:malto-oligosyltrehalose trehalohydrolase
VVDPTAYAWRDDRWTGRPWEEAVIYELHVGAFTPGGTFDAIVERLDDLAGLGVTAIELMPIAAFPGRRNWGYDGVLWFAPAAPYGPPDALKRLVDEAHARGLMMLLDVVYNHLGPDGNYLHAYAPGFFDPDRHTPWGPAPDYAGPHARGVRDFAIQNALHWLEEFHFDGLRLDAVDRIRDPSTPDLVSELARTVREGPGRARHVHLVREDDLNRARALERAPDGAPRLATAQWNDDFHHALHVILTGERDGYYADFAGDPLRHLGRALAEGFAWQGEASPHRHGAPRGEPSGHLPALAFVDFLQNHDQIGNRAFGERLAALVPPDALLAATSILLLSPAVPLVFMGDEVATRTPFLFFCDFPGPLGRAVREGRREEFARFARFAAADAALPDPNAEETFERSRLRPAERDLPSHRRWADHHRRLLAIRREEIVPRLRGIRPGGRFVVGPASLLHVQWTLGDESRLHLHANLGPLPVPAAGPVAGRTLFAVPAGTAGADSTRPAWWVEWTLEGAA